MPVPFRFELVATDPTGARAGVLHTRRGSFPTPIFMPVATHAAFRHLGTHEAWDAGARMLLANTLHLMLKPGPDVFDKLGGIHKMMQFRGGFLTDSGGYQIFSLPEARLITEKGAHFRGLNDNRRHLLSPETSIATQQSIGADVMMVLDVCVDSRTDEAGTRDAMERTHRWALRSLAAKEAKDTGQALFAIVQGGVHEGLRVESADFLREHPFEGFAIGGLAVGDTPEARNAMTELAAKRLPQDKPRYLMGVGTPTDLLEAVLRGVDMFDCIIPTKMAQQGYAYTFQGQVRITRQVFRLDDAPLEEGCACLTCRTYSRAYLHHLCHGKHVLGSRLLALHNVHHYQVLTWRMRNAILEGGYARAYRELKQAIAPAKYLRGGLELEAKVG